MKKRYWLGIGGVSLAGALMLQYIEKNTPDVVEKMLSPEKQEKSEAPKPAPRELDKPTLDDVVDHYFKPKGPQQRNQTQAWHTSIPMQGGSQVASVGRVQTNFSAERRTPDLSIRFRQNASGDQDMMRALQAATYAIAISYGRREEVPASP